MSDIAIHVDDLSKEYRIGQRAKGYTTLRDTLADGFCAPWRRVRNLLRGQASGAADMNSTMWALRDVSFDVERGEVVGLIGRNGAGKSTLLKVLSRITEPTRGHAEIHGRVGSLLEVGTGFHPELTGRENTFLNGAILGMRRVEIDSKFDQIVAFAEVEKFIDTPVKHYSSGMYLRLAFAIAAHLESEILLVDEVLAVGDGAFQKKCLGKIEDVAQTGRTVLLVSHNMAAISSLTRKSLWIDEGALVTYGDTKDVIKQYVSQLNQTISGEGHAQISELKRHPVITLHKAQFDWVQTLNSGGNPTGTFLEGEPIVVELGFRIKHPVDSLQLGCAVQTLEQGVTLFTHPSPEIYQELKPGDYSVRFYIDPNHMRQGDYSLDLKMFADGQRQDTVGQVIRLSIQRYLAPDDNPAYLRKWVVGHMRFDYEWGAIEGRLPPNSTPAVVEERSLATDRLPS